MRLERRYRPIIGIEEQYLPARQPYACHRLRDRRDPQDRKRRDIVAAPIKRTLAGD
jgi:hypothetical protein